MTGFSEGSFDTGSFDVSTFDFSTASSGGVIVAGSSGVAMLTGGLNTVNVDVGSRAYQQALSAIAYNPNPGYVFDSDGAAILDSTGAQIQTTDTL